MKQTRIQVAAPEGGIIYDIGHAPTEWQRYSDSFKELCKDRVVWPVKNGTYRRRHLDPTIRGKLKIKAAKRERVRLMKLADSRRATF